MAAFQHHRGPNRRGKPGGGRRTGDKRGLAPLVLVADEDAHSREMCEAILAKLNFAVAPVDSIEKAASVVETLHPDVIVAHGHDVSALQRAAWPSGVDRKSTRLNSSHSQISYAVFCLKKKNHNENP